MGLPQIKTDHIFTYGEYYNWPQDERWELIEGVAYNMSPAPTSSHQELVGDIFYQLYGFLKDKPCTAFVAPFDVLFPESPGQEESTITTVVQPDVTVVCDSEKITEKGCTGAPDLVVEVLSPRTGKKDLNEKFNLYQRHGVREYWVIDPAARYLRLFRLQEDGKYDAGELFGPDFEEGDPLNAESRLLPGFTLDVKELFSSLD